MSHVLDRVTERDLDVVTAAALFESPAFRSLVLKHVLQTDEAHEFVSVRVSETTDAGETDVMLVVKLADGEKLAVMIEHKIAAPFQPDQAARYRQRGKQGIHEGRWQRFTTCLFAPGSYLLGARMAGEWDAYFILEVLSDWFTENPGAGLGFASRVYQQAVAKRAAFKQVSEQASEFWARYRHMASVLLPGVDISRLPSAVGQNSPWPQFAASRFPPTICLEHKPQQGFVDLTFSDWAPAELHASAPPNLPFDIVQVRTGRSAALRIAVPRLDHLRPFEDQEEAVLASLAAVDRLLEIGNAYVRNHR